MKTRIKTIVAAFVAYASLSGLHASAQEAISSYIIGSPNVVGYATNGAGFAFSPTASIAVTALGFGGSDLANYPYQVSLYNASGTQLATAQVTTGSSLVNQTYYQGISAVDLTVGATYYLGAVEVGDPFGNYWVGTVVGDGLGGTFTVNPDINYLNSETDFFSGIPTNPQGSSYFFVDENFQFTPVPEPSVLCLSAAGLLGVAWSWRRLR
jgi:hypothetical protein